MSETNTPAPGGAPIAYVGPLGSQEAAGFASREDARAWIAAEYTGKPHPDAATAEGARFKALARRAFDMVHPPAGAPEAQAIEAEANAAPVSDVRRMSELADINVVLPAEMGADPATVATMDRALIEMTRGVPAIREGWARELKGAVVDGLRQPEALTAEECRERLVAMNNGDAQAADAEVAAARDALRHFAEAGFRPDYLTETGIGNSPRLVRSLARFGRAFKESGR